MVMYLAMVVVTCLAAALSNPVGIPLAVVTTLLAPVMMVGRTETCRMMAVVATVMGMAMAVAIT